METRLFLVVLRLFRLSIDSDDFSSLPAVLLCQFVAQHCQLCQLGEELRAHQFEQLMGELILCQLQVDHQLQLGDHVAVE